MIGFSLVIILFLVNTITQHTVFLVKWWCSSNILFRPVCLLPLEMLIIFRKWVWEEAGSEYLCVLWETPSLSLVYHLRRNKIGLRNSRWLPAAPRAPQGEVLRNCHPLYPGIWSPVMVLFCFCWSFHLCYSVRPPLCPAVPPLGLLCHNSGCTGGDTALYLFTLS